MNKGRNRVGVLGHEVPGEIRVVDAGKLVSLRAKGEKIGLSGRWGSAWLAQNLPQDTLFPIRVILINHPSFGVPDDWAPLEGLCYRCLVFTPRPKAQSSQFSIDVDSVDFERLTVMGPDSVLTLTHLVLDEVKIEGVPLDRPDNANGEADE
jgi:hypothetical protein